MKQHVKKPGTKLKAVCVLLIAVAILLGLYRGGRWLETRRNNPEPRGNYQERKANEATVTYDGTVYRQRKNLTSILLMGIDHDSGETGGQADFLQLIVIDDTARTLKRLSIDRDTMTPITVLGVLGNRSGVRTAQVSLSHGFGDGKEQSCELTAEAVSNLLLGMPVDFYSNIWFKGCFDYRYPDVRYFYGILVDCCGYYTQAETGDSRSEGLFHCPSHCVLPASSAMNL